MIAREYSRHSFYYRSCLKSIFNLVDKALIANNSAIYVPHSYDYEKINELRLDFQAFIFDSKHTFKTTS